MGVALVVLAKCCKFVNLVLHTIILGVGLYSHILSSWRWYIYTGTGLKLYQICHYYDLSKETRGFVEFYENEVSVMIYFKGTSCPKLWLEEYFVAVIVATFLASLISFKIFSSTDAGLRRLMAIVYHRFTAVLLLSAAVMYAISAVQIKQLDLYVERMYASVEAYDVISLNFMTEAKLLTVALTVLLAVGHLVYSIVAQKSKVADFSAS